MMPDGPKLKATVRQVVALLVQSDYETLEHLTSGARLTAAEMADGVREYGGNLILPPESVFDSLDVIEVEGARPREWGVHRLGAQDLISYTQISRFESGEREPSLQLILLYARAANVSTDVLIDDDLDLPAKLPASRQLSQRRRP